jgi:protein-disulfide isomerase
VLRRELGERVRFAIKFAPLPFHRRAPLACTAALAAGEQGKLWEYLDALFAHPDALDRAGLERTALQLGLDANRFKEALDSGRLAPVLEADASQAQALGISGVPTIYINGAPLVGARPIDEIRAKITEALETAQRNRAR